MAGVEIVLVGILNWLLGQTLNVAHNVQTFDEAL